MNSRKEMKAVLLKQYDRDLAHAIDALEVTTRPIPRPSRGQVLVRMAAAPCNQSDLLLIRGLYGVKKRLPTVPGWEGTGTVVDHGGGLVARRLMGKRVACGGQEDRDGTWAEYFVAGATGCIPLEKEIPWEQGASLIVNPLTAVGLLDETKKLGARAAIQNAAMSQAGRMLVRLFASEGIPLINIVRRPDQEVRLREMGASHVLNSESPEFPERLRHLAHELGATVAFDAVAGPATGALIDSMPAHSTVLVYGALSDKRSEGIDPIDMIFAGKTVRGFYMGEWLHKRGLLGALRAISRVKRLVRRGVLTTDFALRFGINEVREGLRSYVERYSQGKALLLLDGGAGD
ncbi:MAG: zinc-binding dehydrogenase [Acidobacteria bacterium]|nr:zinc-binding dehydrogenase [Acidobacteriota bacterium]